MGLEDDVAEARERLAVLEAASVDTAARLAALEANNAAQAAENMAARLVALEAILAAEAAADQAARAAEDAADAIEAAEDAADAAEDAALEAEIADNDNAEVEGAALDAADGYEQSGTPGSGEGQDAADQSQSDRLPEPSHWYWRKLGG